VAKLPSGGVNKPIWLWWSGTAATGADLDRCRHSFPRRFEIEHMFRLRRWRQVRRRGRSGRGCAGFRQRTAGRGRARRCRWGR
jgi:hypothetical protein